MNGPLTSAGNKHLSEEIHEALKRLQPSDDLWVGIITGAADDIVCPNWEPNEVAQCLNKQEVSGEAAGGPAGLGGIGEY